MRQFHFLHTSLRGRKGPWAAAENQDRILSRRLRHGKREIALIGVADGISRCPCGGKVAAYLIEGHLARQRIFNDGGASLATQLADYLGNLHARFYEQFSDDFHMLESGATLSVALLEENVAHCFWVGDSPVFVARPKGSGFSVAQISVPDTAGRLLTDCFGAGAPFQLKRRRVALQRGDVLVVASDGGIRDESILADLLNTHGVTRAFLRAVKKHASRAEYFDDASIVIAQRAKERKSVA